MRALACGLVSGLLLAGCEAPITTRCPRFTLERSVSVAWIDRLDVLIVIDDAASMVEDRRDSRAGDATPYTDGG